MCQGETDSQGTAEICRAGQLHVRGGWGKGLHLDEKLTARELLKFAGLVNSMSMVIGLKAYIQMKALFHGVCRSIHRRNGGT